MKKHEEEKDEDAPNKQEGILLNGVSKIELPEATNTDESEIEEAFAESIEYEEISEIETSPINEPVKVGEVSEGIKRIELTKTELNTSNDATSEEEDLHPEMLKELMEESALPRDAPQQTVDEEEEEVEGDFHEPRVQERSTNDQTDHLAKVAADSFIGIANQVLEIGGGFFIKIKKTKSHLYFDELLERNSSNTLKPIGDKIDALNTKNINSIKLDPSEIALLKPIIIEVLKSQTKQMTPEQQLIAVGISIAIKKAQVAIQIKADNKLFIKQLDETIGKYCRQFEQDLDRQEEILKRRENESAKEESIDKEAA